MPRLPRARPTMRAARMSAPSTAGSTQGFKKNIPYELWVPIFETLAVPFAADTARKATVCRGDHPLDHSAANETKRLEAFISSVTANQLLRDAAHEAWFNKTIYHGYIGIADWSYDSVRVSSAFLSTSLFKKYGQHIDLHVHLCRDFEDGMIEALLDVLKPCKSLRTVKVKFCPRWHCGGGVEGDPYDAVLDGTSQEKLDEWVQALEPRVREALEGSTKLETLEITRVGH